MEEYRIDIKVKNNIILKKIESLGYSSLGEFCRLNNLMKYVSQLGAIVNMKMSPLTSDGKFRNCINAISNLLGCDPLDLFTDTQIKTILKSNKRSIQVNDAEMKFMLDNNSSQKLLDEHIADEQLCKFTEECLSALTPREEKILKMKFGLIDGKEYTFDEIAYEFNFTRERGRQILAKALRKLRHPNVSNILMQFTDDFINNG